jgi:hypothetical protein
MTLNLLASHCLRLLTLHLLNNLHWLLLATLQTTHKVTHAIDIRGTQRPS